MIPRSDLSDTSKDIELKRLQEFDHEAKVIRISDHQRDSSPVMLAHFSDADDEDIPGYRF